MSVIPYLETRYIYIYIYNFLFSFIIDKCEGDEEGREQGKNGKLWKAVGRDSKKGYGDSQDNWVLHDEISCFRIFECKMCKMEEIMMG
jgi:hypothetical protein